MMQLEEIPLTLHVGMKLRLLGPMWTALRLHGANRRKTLNITLLAHGGLKKRRSS